MPTPATTRVVQIEPGPWPTFTMFAPQSARNSTPAPLVKLTLNALDAINLPIMDPEQYMIADEICILDTSKAKRELGWKPLHRDEDMLLAAYTEYRRAKAPSQQAPRSVAA
jgi:dTDP-glucose 4,6-dehydratase